MYYVISTNVKPVKTAISRILYLFQDFKSKIGTFLDFFDSFAKDRNLPLHHAFGFEGSQNFRVRSLQSSL